MPFDILDAAIPGGKEESAYVTHKEVERAV